ncbi:MAG TPA: ATP synthase F0 subunit B [Acidobacteriota bacterium]|nr:ATP synthase F0 subunit B [Acidobacteriota bacterium]
MISLDGSIIPAVIIFLVLVVALDKILFQPLLRVQEERTKRTSGLMASIRKQLDHHLVLFNQYQAALKNGRLEGYRRQEEVRAAAMNKRTQALSQARPDAEKLIQDAHDSIQAQVQAAKLKLDSDAREIAAGISAAIFRRSA